MRNLFVLIVSSLVALFVAELMLRWVHPIYFAGYTKAYVYDEEVGAVLKPSLDHARTTDYLQEVHTNTLGTVNYQEDFSSYCSKVFAIGDSYTQGTGLPPDASYPAQLDMLLNVDESGYRARIAVVNLGLSAAGIEQAIRLLRRYAGSLGRPAIVLHLGAKNDWLDDLKFDGGYKHRNPVPGSPYWGIWWRPIQWLKTDSQLGKHLFLVVEAFRTSRIPGNDAQPSGRGSAKRNVSVFEQQRPRYERLLAASGELGARLVVGWAGLPGQDGSYEQLRRWASDNGVGFADWAPLVESVREQIPHAPVFNRHSGGHYRVWVNQLIARAYATAIEASGPVGTGQCARR